MNNLKSRMEIPTYEESLPVPDPKTVKCAVCSDDITYGARFTCQVVRDGKRCGTVVCAECIENPAGNYMNGPDVIMCPSCNIEYAEKRLADVKSALDEAAAELEKAQERFERAVNLRRVA